MNKRTSIGIGLHVSNQIIDLQIPNQVSVARLKELFSNRLSCCQTVCQHHLNWLF